MTDQIFSMGTSFNASGGSGEPSVVADEGTASAIKDSDTAHFMVDVIEASRAAPVIVEFWAPWCGPCKQLMPLLEKAVKETSGKVRMVKVDIDTNQQLAAQMRIQSVPAVFAFSDGQPVDGFMGVQPDSEVRAFVKRLAESFGGEAAKLEELVTAGEQAAEQHEYDGAAQFFGHALQLSPENGRAIAGMAKVYIAIGDLENARQLLDVVPPALVNDPHLSSAMAALSVAETPVDDGEISRLSDALSANETDMQTRLNLSIALNAAGRSEEALDHLMWIIERDREWNDAAARKQLLNFFEAWGPKNELTLAGRRRLSSVLFA